MNEGMGLASSRGRATTRPALEQLLETYKLFCYRVVGEKLDAKPDRLLMARLKQADYNVTPGLYKAMLMTTALAAAVGALALSASLFVAVLGFDSWPLWVGVTALAAGASTAIAFPATVGARIANRRAELDKELPFSLSELSVLASIGLSPITLMRRMAARKHDAAMTGEFRKVVFMTDVQGKDVVTALAETAKESPSPMVRETFWDLSTMIHQGGNLDQYLRTRSQEVIEKKRLDQKSFIDRLGTYAEMYVTVVLLGVMFLAIGAFVLDAFGRRAGVLDAAGLLSLQAYGIIPLIVIVLGVLLSSAYQKVQT